MTFQCIATGRRRDSIEQIAPRAHVDRGVMDLFLNHYGPIYEAKNFYQSRAAKLQSQGIMETAKDEVKNALAPLDKSVGRWARSVYSRAADSLSESLREDEDLEDYVILTVEDRCVFRTQNAKIVDREIFMGEGTPIVERKIFTDDRDSRRNQRCSDNPRSRNVTGNL